MTVLGVRRSSTPCEHVDEMFGLDNIREMLARSDYVVVTTPITEHTPGMIGEAEFRAMKPGAYFIVTSRGGVADTEALLQALENGWIAGAGLDAHEIEPVRPTHHSGRSQTCSSHPTAHPPAPRRPPAAPRYS